MYQETAIIGRLGRDPELKNLPNGTQICNVSVAVSEYWTDKQTNERKEKTYWYKLAWFGKSAEYAAQRLRKGGLVFAKGTVEAKAYMGQDGEPKASLEMRVNQWQALSSNGAASDEYSEDEEENYPF